MKRAIIDKDNVQIPNFHLTDGWNDRFAIGSPETMIRYGDRYLYALDYSRSYQLHSEKYLAYHMERFKKTPEYIHFPFRRIRANGGVCPLDDLL